MRDWKLVKQVSKTICCGYYRGHWNETAELMDLMDELAKKRANKRLETADDYAEEYLNKYYTYKNFSTLCTDEWACGGLSQDELIMAMGVQVFQLPCGWYVHEVG